MASTAAQAAPSASGSGASWTSASAASRSGGKVVSTLTLITGDKVSLDAKGRVVRVVPGEGRQGVPVSVKKIHGHTYVIPLDAARLLAKGKLDRRLFDVTELLKAKYDDESRDSLPLIVSYTSGKQEKAQAKSALERADVTVRRSLPVLNGSALTAPKSASAEVWEALTDETSGRARTSAEGIAKVWLDGVRRASLDKSVPQIGAPTAWDAGYTGKGVKVAVLDTGVDQTHADLAGAQIAEKNFSEAKDAVDRVGHGTHVASIITGSGAKSGGKYKGVAPDAQILDGKVLDDDGYGNDSGILAGMEWAVGQGAKIVNLSLGGTDSPEDDPLEVAVNNFTVDKGVLFAIAAGNEGPGAGTIGSPGSAKEALTVGAVDKNDLIAEFSSVGPTADGSLKPDVTAPGVDIVAAKAAKGAIGDPAADGYVSLSGTSMATPHVAGAAALLAQEHPDWTGRQLKQALASSAKPGAGLNPYQQGTGRIDLTKAIEQSVVSEQTALDFGTQRWPHDDDVAVTKKVSYRNLGTEDVTLDLALETTGPDGKPAPAGVFTASAKQLTVPAGGTAEAEVTADTKAGTADGAYSGALVATAGEQSVRTAVAVNREVESYDLTMKVINGKGKAGESWTTLVGLDNDTFASPEDTDGDGVMKLRLPKGTYAAEVPVFTDDDVALLVQPRLALTKNQTVTYDARKAKKISISSPDSKSKAGYGFLSWDTELGSSSFASVWGFDGFKGVTTAHVGDAVTKGSLNAVVGADWYKKATAYSTAYPRTKTFFTGYSHKPVASEFAKVKVAMGEPAKNKVGASYASWDNGVTGFGVGMTDTALPGTMTHYVTASKGLKWGFMANQFDSATENEEAYQESAPVAYKAKKTYGATFNVGVFGPSVGTSSDGAGATRYEDELGVCVPMFSDGKGHLGDSVTSKAKTVITADGKTIINEKTAPCGAVAGVPDAKTTYKVSTDLSRSSKLSGITTRVTADWTFTSERPAPEKLVDLKLSSVRFSPKLSVTGTAQAGKKLTVPVTVLGSAAGKNLKKLEVWASYDGGTTWHKASVKTDSKGNKSVTLSNPKSATSVSLKAKVSDKDGNVANQAIYKAYKLVK